MAAPNWPTALWLLAIGQQLCGCSLLFNSSVVARYWLTALWLLPICQQFSGVWSDCFNYPLFRVILALRFPALLCHKLCCLYYHMDCALSYGLCTIIWTVHYHMDCALSYGLCTIIWTVHYHMDCALSYGLCTIIWTVH